MLHVGGAGLTLPRYVAATRPRSRQIVLEPDEDLTEFVRETLPIPKRTGIKVRPQTGRAGIREVYDASTDVVVVDAFLDEAVPRDLLTSEFTADCAWLCALAICCDLASAAAFCSFSALIWTCRSCWVESRVSMICWRLPAAAARYPARWLAELTSTAPVAATESLSSLPRT